MGDVNYYHYLYNISNNCRENTTYCSKSGNCLYNNPKANRDDMNIINTNIKDVDVDKSFLMSTVSLSVPVTIKKLLHKVKPSLIWVLT